MASATLANLDVNLFARTVKTFDRPVNKSASVFTGFRSLLGTLPGPAAIAKGAFAVVAAGAAGAAAGVYALTSSIDEYSEQVTNFERFGLDTGKSFGQFAVLASDARLEMEDMIDLAKDLGVRIGEANLDGEGEVFDLFQRLGMDVQALAQMDPASQLQAYAEAISKVSSENERLAITDILLSDAGTKALQVLERGAEGFTEAADRAGKFGLNISNIDSANLQLANQAMSNFSLISEGIWTQFASQGAPIVTALAEMFTEAAAEAGGFNGVIGDGFDLLIEGIDFGIDSFNVLFSMFEFGTGTFLQMVASMLDGLGRLESVMINMGGSEFDFGIQRAAATLDAIAGATIADSRARFEAGLDGTGGDAFQQRINEIRAEARATADRNFGTDIVPPDPQFDIAAFGSNLLKDFNQFLVDNPLQPKIAAPVAAPDPQRGPQALSFGSSAAQTLVNQLSRRNTEANPQNVPQAIRKNGQQQLNAVNRNRDAIEKQTDDLVSVGEETNVLLNRLVDKEAADSGELVRI